VTILGISTPPAPVAVRITGSSGYGSFRGFYMLFYGFPELNSFARPGVTLATAAKQQQQTVINFPGTNLFKDPPTQRNWSTVYGDIAQPFPYIERADNDKTRDLYHLELGGDNVDTPVLINPDTKAAFPQVAVIPRTAYWANKIEEWPWYIHGYMNILFRPLDEKSVVTLRMKGVFGRYGLPTVMRVWDADGKLLIESSVLPDRPAQERRSEAGPGGESAALAHRDGSAGDAQMNFTGATS